MLMLINSVKAFEISPCSRFMSASLLRSSPKSIGSVTARDTRSTCAVTSSMSNCSKEMRTCTRPLFMSSSKFSNDGHWKSSSSSEGICGLRGVERSSSERSMRTGSGDSDWRLMLNPCDRFPSSVVSGECRLTSMWNDDVTDRQREFDRVGVGEKTLCYLRWKFVVVVWSVRWSLLRWEWPNVRAGEELRDSFSKGGL